MRRITALTALVATIALARPASASLKLDVLSPTTSGVGAFAGSMSFSPDSATPTLASSLSSSAFASSGLDDGNTATRLFTLGATSFGSEGAAFSWNTIPSNIFIDFSIDATAGETGPVCLTIDNDLKVNNCPEGYLPSAFYSYNGGTHLIFPGLSSDTFNLNVGDTFQYGVFLSDNAYGASALLSNKLSVTPCPSPSEVPEPCSLALLGLGGLPMVIRRRRNATAA